MMIGLIRTLIGFHGLIMMPLFVYGRDTYDKMRADLRLMKEEAQRIETSQAPKVRTHNDL